VKDLDTVEYEVEGELELGLFVATPDQCPSPARREVRLGRSRRDGKAERQYGWIRCPHSTAGSA